MSEQTKKSWVLEMGNELLCPECEMMVTHEMKHAYEKGICPYCGFTENKSKSVTFKLTDAKKVKEIIALNRDLVKTLSEVLDFLNNDDQYSGKNGAWRQWHIGCISAQLEKSKVEIQSE